MKQIFIIPFDGLMSVGSIMSRLAEILDDPSNMIDFVSHVKLNDAFHFDGIKKVLFQIIEKYPKINIFFDLKLPDTNGTNKNILGHYLKYMRVGDIVTINSNCSLRAFDDVRAILPDGVKIALVSVLTDTAKPECQSRRGMSASMSILNDASNLLAMRLRPFDAIVCSPDEIVLLDKNLSANIAFVVPGIRDDWMEAGQQAKDRINGVKEALDMGGTREIFLVMGSQLTKGNSSKGIDAAQSRAMSIEKALSSNAIHFVPGDPLQTLVNLKGFYQSPRDEDGKLKGPLVAYAGTYDSPTGKKNYVGDTYFNLAVIEDHPQRITYFAEIMAKKIKKGGIKVDCLVGIPAGGSKIAQETGRLLNIPGICLEKKVVAIKTATAKEKFELFLRRNAGVIQAGNRVILFEDLCNNFSTTEKAVKVVEDSGGEVVAIACIANRSLYHQMRWKAIPVISEIDIPSPQFEQENTEVAYLIAQGQLSTDPKKDWQLLRRAME